MKCQFCAADYPDTLSSCPNCGTPANQSGTQPQTDTPYFSNQTMGNPEPVHTYTEKEFYKLPELELCRSNIKGSAILLYICAVFNLIICLLFSSYSMLLDIILTIVLAVFIQVKKSRVCSVILLIYACINVIVLLISTGRPGGYFYLIAAACAINYTFKYQKAWKVYKETGVLPNYFKKGKKK